MSGIRICLLYKNPQLQKEMQSCMEKENARTAGKFLTIDRETAQVSHFCVTFCFEPSISLGKADMVCK